MIRYPASQKKKSWCFHSFNLAFLAESIEKKMSGADIQQVKCVAVGDGAVGEFYSVDSIKRTVHLAFHGLFSLLKILFTKSKQYFW